MRSRSAGQRLRGPGTWGPGSPTPRWPTCTASSHLSPRSGADSGSRCRRRRPGWPDGYGRSWWARSSTAPSPTTGGSGTLPGGGCAPTETPRRANPARRLTRRALVDRIPRAAGAPHDGEQRRRRTARRPAAGHDVLRARLSWRAPRRRAGRARRRRATPARGPCCTGRPRSRPDGDLSGAGLGVCADQLAWVWPPDACLDVICE